MAAYTRNFDTPRQAGLDQVQEVWDALTTVEESDIHIDQLVSRLQEKGILPGSGGKLDKDGVERVANILAAMELVKRGRDLLWISIGPLEFVYGALEEIRERQANYHFTTVEIHTDVK